jgi:hypothetical protein
MCDGVGPPACQHLQGVQMTCGATPASPAETLWAKKNKQADGCDFSCRP